MSTSRALRLAFLRRSSDRSSSFSPPWPNSSATRASAYETFDAYDLGKLNVKALLGDTPCVVAVWVTNRPKVRFGLRLLASPTLTYLRTQYRRLLTEQLFPAWGITSPAAEWYWVKIASAEGEPVWDLDSKHRRCYEGAHFRTAFLIRLAHTDFPAGLVLGYYNPQRVPIPSLPAEKIFLSVPLSHSRKPVIAGVPILLPQRWGAANLRRGIQISSAPTSRPSRSTARQTFSSSLRARR